MHNKTFLYFLIFIICFSFYKIYELSKRNDRLHKICTDQKQVMDMQNSAIYAQSLYIMELEKLRESARTNYIH